MTIITGNEVAALRAAYDEEQEDAKMLTHDAVQEPVPVLPPAGLSEIEQAQQALCDAERRQGEVVSAYRASAERLRTIRDQREKRPQPSAPEDVALFLEAQERLQQEIARAMEESDALKRLADARGAEVAQCRQVLEQLLMRAAVLRQRLGLTLPPQLRAAPAEQAEVERECERQLTRVRERIDRLEQTMRAAREELMRLIGCAEEAL